MRARLSLYLAPLAVLVALAAALVAPLPAFGQADGDVPQPQRPAPICEGHVYADVVALDQVYYWNRLGAFEPQGMVYALERDVVNPAFNQTTCTGPLPSQGQAILRRDRRPRPLVLRANVGDCLHIKFSNWLATPFRHNDQPHTRAASIHVAGMQYVTSQADSGLNVGLNGAGGVIPPGGVTNYTLYAQEQGTYLMYSGGAMVGGEGEGGSIFAGLFGAVNVQPRGSKWYRSQVTELDLRRTFGLSGSAFPVINYEKKYTAATAPYCGATGLPILNMLGAGNKIVHSDLTAIITGPNADGSWSSAPPPSGPFNPVSNIYPDRNRPYREFTIIFHDEVAAVQAFPAFYDEVLQHTLHSVRDAFAINYGTGGAGAEIFANRLSVGPMWNCVECLYEEFFLTSWAVGDPAMVVDIPANSNLVHVGTATPCTSGDIKDGANCVPAFPGRQATRALYPDDPSNVYHSYLNDNVKFRNLHAGIEDHHIFHLHAHQWLHSPESDKAAYHDSQAIGQGSSFTYEITYGGSGNRNSTVGDSIFHCHFYPHFAQGMWGLWRVHDVLELGTKLDAAGKPVHSVVGASTTVNTTRALPDGEILVGTPIPAIVPIPGEAMAPIPAPITLVNGNINWPAVPAVNPGYPFFVPAEVSHRPPHPPLDTLWDGGLPRHVVQDGLVGLEEHDRLSFDKHVDEIEPLWIPEAGTPVEDVAMNFHAAGSHPTRTPSGAVANFQVNQGGRVRGAPFADPCLTDAGVPIPVTKTYKGAVSQMDIVINKEGWHYPQQRLITLWEDVAPTLDASRPPQPFFFRANSGECIEFQHVDLVPKTWELDDYQVRTPTDIIGQHIHLVKFDVLASDGGGNGFNYEDGTFSGEEVQARIAAIRLKNKCADGDVTPHGVWNPECPMPQDHPFFKREGVDANCDGKDDWFGAQTTVQRWWADPVKDNSGVDRTLRTVFTHDHFGPSTHQQAGLYAGLIIEPKDSSWFENESNTPLNTRDDGGPTTWQARIITNGDDFREFGLEFADFQLAYWAGGKYPSAGKDQRQLVCPGGHYEGYTDPDASINPPNREEVGPPSLYVKADHCPVNACDLDGSQFYAGGLPVPLPCPEAVSAADPGTGVVNYRSEPIALRVRDPLTNGQAAGDPGDLSFAYESRTDRADWLLNSIDSPMIPYPQLTGGLVDGDPFTPLMRAYEDDKVKVRVLVGAHEEEHGFSFNGVKWLHEADDPASGWRASQMMGISEAYNFDIDRVPSLPDGMFADYLYKPSTSEDFQWAGIWGLMRLYRGLTDLPTLPSNPDARGHSETVDAELFDSTKVPIVPNFTTVEGTTVEGSTLAGTSAGRPGYIGPAVQPIQRISCPVGAPLRTYDLVAVAASSALPGGTLVYNTREDAVTYINPPSGECVDGEPAYPGVTKFGPLHDPTAIMFVRRADLTATLPYQLLPNVNPEPLIIRANAGECIEVKLYNALPDSYLDLPGYSGVPMVVDGFNANDIQPSKQVGLHPQLVEYDVRQGDGMNVGMNRFNTGFQQTVAPGQSVTYYWYGGQLGLNFLTGTPELQPIEYGATALSSSDPIKHSMEGAVGAMIIEPRLSTWTVDLIPPYNLPVRSTVKTYAAAWVKPELTDGFREFVTIYQDDINLRFKDWSPVPNVSVYVDPSESGNSAFNYRTEPIWFRMGYTPDTPPNSTRNINNFDQVLLNSFTGTEPETPIFYTPLSTQVRFRVLHPAGDTQAQTFELTGHLWQEEPYAVGPATKVPSESIGYNALSNWQSVRTGVAASNHFNAQIPTAGGAFGVAGDYLYKTYVQWSFNDGMWGLMRVDPTWVQNPALPANQ